MGRIGKLNSKSYFGFENLELYKLEDSNENFVSENKLNIGGLIGGISSGLILISILVVIFRKKFYSGKKKYESNEFIDDNFNDIQMESKNVTFDSLNHNEDNQF